MHKRFQKHFFFYHNIPKYLDSYEHKLKHLKLPPRVNRRSLHDLVFLHKLVKGVIDSSYLLNKLNVHAPSRTARPFPFTLFAEKFTRTRQGRHSPINRLTMSLIRIINWSAEIIMKKKWLVLNNK